MLIKADLKRIFKYILITALVSAVLVQWGVKAAYAERGYQAVGGEYLLPFYIAAPAMMIYKYRKPATEEKNKEVVKINEQ